MMPRRRLLLTLVAVCLLGACQKVVRHEKIDDGIIISQAAAVRNSTAVLAIELAQVKRAEDVEILEKLGKDWVKVRTKTGVEGWIESRQVISKRTYEQAMALAEEAQAIPAQAPGQLIGHAALRLTPGRASENNLILSVPSNTMVEILSRERTPRMSDEVLPKRYQPRTLRRGRGPEAVQEQPSQYDYWYLVRLLDEFLIRVGWIYAPLVELKVPERLVHLQGDYNIIAWYELAKVNDPEIGDSVHYLTFDRHRTDPIPGTDFDHIRLWVWDVERHGYKIGRWEIARGILPIAHSVQNAIHRFTMKLYNQKTGELENTEYTVDVSDPFNPRPARLRR